MILIVIFVFASEMTIIETFETTNQQIYSRFGGKWTRRYKYSNTVDYLWEKDYTYLVVPRELYLNKS